ncbi:hypothetical protein Trydic_g23747 [Trypoxylus dichotomus]
MVILELVQSEITANHPFYWNGLAGLSHCKNRGIYSGEGRLRKVALMSRAKLRALTAVLTGHCVLNKFIHRMGFVNSPSCRKCVRAKETRVHLLIDSPAVCGERQIHLGDAQLDTAS